MRQHNNEKQIIDTLRKISIPGPDSEFEHDLRMQFVKKAQAKRRTKRVGKRLAWIGSFAAAGILVFMLVQGNMLQQIQNMSSEQNIEDSALYSISGIEETAPSINSREAELTKRTNPSAQERVVISEENLFEIYNYPAGNKGDWRFYQNEQFNTIYASNDQAEAQLLYAVEEGYVNAHIYPNPNEPNTYVLVLIDSMESEQDRYHFYQLHNEGSLTNIPDAPEGNYDSVQLQWSPNGEKAFLHMLDTNRMKSSLGILDSEQDAFTLIHGGIMDEAGDPNNAEGAYVSIATWLDDRYILLYNHLFGRDSYTFHKLDAEMRGSSTTAFSPPTDPFNVLELHSLGKNELAVLKTGTRRYDVGFEPSYRLYLVNMKSEPEVRRTLFTPLEAEGVPIGSVYEQDFLGVTTDGNMIVSDIIQGEEYALSLRIIDPLSTEVIWKYEGNYPRVIANPTVVYSPEQSKLALRLYSELATTNKDGNTALLPAPFYYLVVDLAHQQITLNEESDTYDLPEWIDENTLKISEEVFDFSKNN